ncbi:unnamed protein product [Brassicogethes aeneus]|uniref:Uncharacterized protein n=1 Tax=Brassicogethes aeneus TaxID=1431903 RepID=A0A9P0B6N5_BRAAE|nr:unnamed protein product [Brassicogethes aeneus]
MSNTLYTLLNHQHNPSFVLFNTPPLLCFCLDPVRAMRSRTNSACALGETDFVLLQSSPIGHMHWQPVGYSIGGQSGSLSDLSSRCSWSSQPPSPVAERRPSSLKSEDFTKKGRHVFIKAEYSDNTPRVGISSNNSLALYENVEGKKQEYKTTASQTKPRPNSLYLIKHDTKQRHRNRSKSIDNTLKKKESGFEKLNKFKDKLLHSSPELNENSDNESTPLVSEVSSPSKSGQSSDVKTSESNSVAVSPSPTPDVQRQQTRSEMNLTEQAEESLGGADGLRFSPSEFRRTRTMSDCTNSSISAFLGSIGHSNSNYSVHSKSSAGSGHLSRQNALESEENLENVYDPVTKH